VSGFPWTFGAAAAVGALSVLAISFSILLMVWLSARRLKKMPPVAALRGSISAKDFRRNYFPLEKFPGNVNLGLGLKNMLAYFKTYAMIGAIVAGISLAIVFMAIAYQNFGVDYSALIKLVGIENCDVLVTVTQRTDAAALASEIERMPEVRKTAMMDFVGLKIDGYDAFGTASDDYGRYETFFPTKGRMPIYDNEAAIPGRFARQLGKVIGDGVRITVNGVSQDYIITGHFSTAMSDGGRAAAITLDGFKRLDPHYMRGSISIYLNDGVTQLEFSEKLKQQFGVLNVIRNEGDGRFAAARARAEEKISAYMEHYNIDSGAYSVIYNGEIILSRSSDAYQIEKIEDFNEFVKSNIGVFGDIIGSITIVVVVVSFVISSLILSMTIRSIITKRRRELGILKSNGFTTKQLARQMAISFMPMTAIGIAFGCIGAALTISPAMGLALYSTGAESIVFDVSLPIVVFLGLAILFATYIVANISAMRIKHISVYELMSE
jgi:putative ABC transport system permease protein